MSTVSTRPISNTFSFLAISISIICAVALIFYGLQLFKWITAYLPLLLPLAVTILSIFTRASDIKSLEAVLKICNDIAIGIISFDIWAFSTSRGEFTKSILVNPEKMIDGEFVLPFLLIGLLTAVGCVVLTNYNFKDERLKMRCLLGAFLLSIVVYIAPFGVIEPVPKAVATEKTDIKKVFYKVVIPYQDPMISRIAPTVLGERVFAKYVYNIAATTPEDAKQAAVNTFLKSPESNQFRAKDNEKVVIYENAIVVTQ